ncbi:MAG: class II aldolase/adducin family protein [Chloroflexota bacterium]
MAATSLPDRPDLLRDLVLANRILAHEGVVDAFGHVSIRHPDDPERFIVSRSLGPELVTEADLQVFALDGAQVGGHPDRPYAERVIHGAVYEARPEVMAVCHNHAPSVIPFSVTGVPLRPIAHLAAPIGAEIPVWDIADRFGETDMLVRTIEQARSLAATLAGRTVALMRGHGSVVAGPNVRAVTSICVYLERNAQLLLQALTLVGATGGTPDRIHYLSDGEIALQGSMDGLSLDSLGLQRAWTTWVGRVGG